MLPDRFCNPLGTHDSVYVICAQHASMEVFIVRDARPFQNRKFYWLACAKVDVLTHVYYLHCQYSTF